MALAFLDEEEAATPAPAANESGLTFLDDEPAASGGLTLLDDEPSASAGEPSFDPVSQTDAERSGAFDADTFAISKAAKARAFQADADRFRFHGLDGQPIFREGSPNYRPPITDQADLRKLRETKHAQLEALAQDGDESAQTFSTVNRLALEAAVDPVRETVAPYDYLSSAGNVQGPLGAFARGVQRRLGGTAGGLAGLGLGAALAPETGGMSILLPLIGAFGGAQAGEMEQEGLQRATETPPETAARFEKMSEDEREHFWAGKVADLSMILPFFRPSPTQLANAAKAVGYLRLGATVPAAERAALTNTLGAFGIGAGQHVATSALTGQPVTLEDVLKSGAEMALFSKTTPLGKALGLPFHEETPEVAAAANHLESAGLPRSADTLRALSTAPEAPKDFSTARVEAAPRPPVEDEAGAPAPDGATPNDAGRPGETLPPLPTAEPVEKPAVAPAESAGRPTPGDEQASGNEPQALPSTTPAAPRQFVQSQRAMDRGDDLVPVNVATFDAAFARDPDFYIGNGGKNTIPGRREGFLDYLETGKPVDAPEVTVSADGSVSFTDGRHRYATLRAVGDETIPMSMDAESAANARKFGYASDSSPSNEAAKSDTPPAPPAKRPLTPLPAGEHSATSIRNAIVDRERESRGLPPAMATARKEMGEAWDEALHRIEHETGVQDQLIIELSAKARPVSDVENALLLHRQIELQNEFDSASRGAVAAHEAGDFGTAEEARLRTAALSDQLQQIYDVGKSVGTENSRGLNSRKMLAAEDYSLPSLETRKRAANGGRRLTAEESAEVGRRHAEIERTRRALDEHEAAKDEAGAREAAAGAVKELVASVKKGSPARTRRAETKTVEPQAVSWLKAQADAARARIEARRGTLHAKILPVNLAGLADEAIIAASHIASGVTDFANWSHRMLADFGESITPHLEALWDRGHELLRNANHAQTIVGKMSVRIRQGATLSDLRPYVTQIAKEVIRSGVTELDPLVSAVHSFIAYADPKVTRRAAMDLLSGYGVYRPLSKDAIDVTLRDLRGQGQQLAKLEDLRSGQAPRKTGVEQREPSDKERALIAKVNELKKRSGIVTTDPATQLKSALDGIKTRLRHQISDLARQIDTGEKPEPRDPTPRDAETENLSALRDRLKETLSDLEGPAELTDAQRAAIAARSLESSIAEYTRRLEENDFAARKKQPLLSTPEVDALRARRDALKAEYQELRELDEEVAAGREEATVKALKSSIAVLDERLKSSDLSPAPRPAPTDSAAVEALKSERAAMQRQLADMRREATRKTPDEIERRKIEAAQKALDDLDAKVRAGDLATKPRNAAAVSAAREAILAEKAALQKLVHELRRGPKKSREEVTLAALKTRYANREAELREKLARGDFAPKAKRTTALDEEGLRRKAAYEKAKLDFDRGLVKDRLEKRGPVEKVLDATAKWRRAFVLSGVKTLAKLTSSAMEIMAITPLEELAGGAISKVPGISAIAKKAPRHGGLSLQAEVDAITATVRNYFRDLSGELRHGKMDIDLAYGKPDLAPPEWKDFFGHLHGALKAPARRNEFTRSFTKRMEFAARNGVDVTDPVVQTAIGVKAYQDASASIFSEKNFLTDAYKRFLGRLGEADKATGKPGFVPKVTQTALRVTLPVVSIPTNIVFRALEYSLGTVSGTARIARAAVNGLDNLHPDEADAIMRNFKRGSFGVGVFLLGFALPSNFGGYYQHGEKRKPGDVKYGGARIGGVEIPKMLVHHPLLECAQIGATARRVMDSKLHKKDRENQGLAMGLFRAFVGILEETPFVGSGVRSIHDVISGHTDIPGAAVKLVTPVGVQQVAEYFDRDSRGETVKRAPNGLLQHVEAVIPGARRNLPKKEPVKARGH